MIKKHIIPIKGIAICAFLFYSILLDAQMDHYWSNNFNTSSALLGGAVVGGDPDASSIYYNPSMISQADQANLALSANLFKFEMVRYNNALGEDLNIKKDQFNVIPRFVSYTTHGGDNIDIELAFFTRNQDEISVFENYSVGVDILNLPDGDEFYNGTMQYSRKYSDQWFSLGLSQQLSDNFSLGVGTYFPLKNYRSESELDIRAFPMTDNVTYDSVPGKYYVASTTENSVMKAWDLRLLWKLGMHYQAGDLGIGLTITTPSLHLFGTGSIKRELSRINIYDPGTLDPIGDAAIIDFQEDLKVNLKDPFSIAFGLHYAPEGIRSAVMMTVEYFAPISNYDVLQPEAGNEQATDSIIDLLNGTSFLTTQREAVAVLNVALGYRYRASEKLYLITGVRTDFTSVDKEIGQDLSREFNLIPYDIYHITIGVDAKFPRLEIVTGLQYSVGRKSGLSQLTNFTDAVEYNETTGRVLQGTPQETMTVKYNVISLFLGFTYNFIKE